MENKIKLAKIVARLLDSQFEILGVKFGFDPIINLIPWVGDIIGAILSLYILNIGWKMEIKKSDLAKMIWNIIADFLLGAIPFLGIFFDVIYKSNLRNIQILEKYQSGFIPKGKVIDGTIIS